MSKAGLDLKDFSIAPGKAGPKPEEIASMGETAPAALPPPATDRNVTTMLPAPNKQHRRQTAEARAKTQEDARYSLKNLKRSKQRNIKFFVNIALDYEMKARLQRAAQENDVKMTAIVKAALDYYLSENGY